MRKAEQIVSLLWIGFSIGVCIASLRLDLGRLSDPGPGFLPLGTGALIGILALSHFVRVTFLRTEKRETKLSWTQVHWEKGCYVVIALTLYAILLEWIGYIVSTFALMLFLFSILERRSWWSVLIRSLLVIIVTYFVFARWLMVQFPKGVLGI